MIEALLYPYMSYKDKIPSEKITHVKEIIEQTIAIIMNDVEKLRLN
jgi:hypothetical protein